MSSTPERRLPFHPALPFENVFSSKDAQLAGRVATIVENHMLTGIRNAQTFKTQPSDVILVSGPCCGEETVGKIIAALVSDDPEALASRSENWSLPWIESRHTEENPSDLSCFFFSDNTRVLRTQMAMTMLNPRHRKGPKYIALLRHPLDMRACFFKYLRACAKVSSPQPPNFDFDDLFPSADSFASVPVTLCDISSSDPASYEQFVYDWYRESRTNPDVHLMFYESLIADPIRTITRLAAFLEGSSAPTINWQKKPNEPAFKPEPSFTLDELRMLAAIRIGQLNPQKGTETKRKTKARGLKRMSMAIQRKARSISGRSGSSSSQSSMYTDGDGDEGMGGSHYEDPVSVRTILNYWNMRVGLHPASYEKMYESDICSPYPFPQISLPKSASAAAGPSPLQETVSWVMNAAKSRLTKVNKEAISEKLKLPASVLKGKSQRKLGNIQRDTDMNSGSDGIERPENGLHSHTFAGDDWTTSTVLNHELAEPTAEHLLEEEETEAADLNNYRMAQLSNSDSAGSSQVPVQSMANKFVSQEVMEANMLRSSMRLAGVNKAIVDVVAVKQEHLSEML